MIHVVSCMIFFCFFLIYLVIKEYLFENFSATMIALK